MRRARPWWLLAPALASCGPSPAAQAPAPPSEVNEEPSGALARYGPEHVGLPLPGEDICEKNPDGSIANPIEPGTYQGILRNARCEQQKFLTMARITEALGVACNHCHVPHPTDPKKEDYPVMTDRKRTANWMYKTFIQGLRPIDGSRMQCASCHTDRDSGEPVAKILRHPRDRDHAQEWMHEVMTVKFVEQNGKRLKCKTCHVGMAPDTAGWIKDVVRYLRYEGTVERRDEVAGDSGE